VWKRVLRFVEGLRCVEVRCQRFLQKKKNFKSFEKMFVVTFVFKMSSFQMESLKVMEKFDGGNFQLWKFKMRMMLSKHGLCVRNTIRF
jgi:hypothetical protein